MSAADLFEVVDRINDLRHDLALVTCFVGNEVLEEPTNAISDKAWGGFARLLDRIETELTDVRDAIQEHARRERQPA